MNQHIEQTSPISFEDLKKELDFIQLEDRLEMVQSVEEAESCCTINLFCDSEVAV